MRWYDDHEPRVFEIFVRRHSFHGNFRTELHTSQIPYLDITNLLSQYVLSANVMTILKAGVGSNKVGVYCTVCTGKMKSVIKY